MIVVLGGLTITTPVVWAILIYGTICLIQPWSLTFKTIGAMIGMCAYGAIPLLFAGGAP